MCGDGPLYSTNAFLINSAYGPSGDQNNAIEELSRNLCAGKKRQVLLGVTGSGKTFTVAKVIEKVNRPALVIAHNKTLAAQLYSEFQELFPENAVRYFVSYYDYYRPEAYLPATDTYIEKDAAINEEIDKLRHATTKALLERRDCIVVASVSCIYGLGAPENYFNMMLYLEAGDRVSREEVVKKLVMLQYLRNDVDFRTGRFRVRGDVVEICPAYEDSRIIRIEFFGNEVEELSEVDRLSAKVLRRLERICIYPASHFVTTKERLKQAVQTIRRELRERLSELERQSKVLEARRLEQRTLYDIELLEEMGFCPGIENYSRHLTGGTPGEPPPTLLSYFPEDLLVFIDESHVTVPQLVGMYRGDRARKQTLVDYGFRLPSALDNRPLRFDEFEKNVGQVIFVSATPAEFEIGASEGFVVEQIIRPTGLLDPEVVVRPAISQVEDFLGEIKEVVGRGERVLLTTLTKKMAEDLSTYYREIGVRVRYLHSEIHTLDRIELIRGLREGEFDVLVGINLLREGLDLPEVSLVGIMDADKEGFLRSQTSLIQTIGRAARHLHGRVILYADVETRSIKAAVAETNRRREIQQKHNETHGIIPTPVRRARDGIGLVAQEYGESGDRLWMGVDTNETIAGFSSEELPHDIAGCKALIERMRGEMLGFAAQCEFEKAASLRDKISWLEKYMLGFCD
ncbi:MAG: excinuclease ABC subunit UvrB [Deltaproteobacteria bacterium]|nr:excinuclease ABC subunit UvrB [Deltaproteobacteria bacterium]